MEKNNKFILDACCACKAFWYNKNHPNTLYIDIREEEKGFIKQRKALEVKPDMIMDFRSMDLKDKSFKLVVWDPPHMKTLGQTSMFRKKFGCLNVETWPQDLKQGFNECWRVLEDYGVLIFKWNDCEIPFKSVLKLFPVEPLFGSVLKNKMNNTHWTCFMKIPKEKK